MTGETADGQDTGRTRGAARIVFSVTDGRNARTGCLDESRPSPMWGPRQPAAAALGGRYGVRGQHGDEAHPKVEDVSHFPGGDPPCLLQRREKRRQLPAIGIHRRQALSRQYPHQITRDSSSGNVCQTMQAGRAPGATLR